MRRLLAICTLSSAALAGAAPGSLACDGAEAVLQLKLSQFPRRAQFPEQNPDTTGMRASLQLGCRLPMGDDSGLEVDVYGDYDSITSDYRFDIYSLNYYADMDDFTLALGYQQKPMGHLEADQPNNLYNPKAYHEGIFERRSLGRFALGGIYRRESWALHLDLMPVQQTDSWPEEKGRFRRSAYIAGDEEFASGTNLSAQLRWDYFSGGWELSGMLWRGLSPQPIVQISAGDSTAEPVAVSEFYERISQAGFSALYLVDNLSLKADVYYRHSAGRELVNLAPGLSWQFYNLGAGRADATLFLEGYYLKDVAGSGIALPSSFDRDLYAGARISFNDTADSQLEVGMIRDLNLGSMSGYGRLTRSVMPQLEYRLGFQWFDADRRDIVLAGFDSDSHIYVGLIWYP